MQQHSSITDKSVAVVEEEEKRGGEEMPHHWWGGLQRLGSQPCPGRSVVWRWFGKSCHEDSGILHSCQEEVKYQCFEY